ncbi:right-handed parallel beta-helix repeat-containing protein, partial [Wenyingzhuangia sp.]|uniref:right-handed parallel beta-helix repeat-containing protein n=1 Tax=Wenyingzhuangia sp. TaxID=1964193 RepID=UPI0032192C7E
MYKAQKQSSLSISLFFFLLIIVIISASYTNSYAAIIYVKHNAIGSNNGISWTNAYTALQDAINNSSAGDEIWVAEGTYKPNTIVPFTTPSTDNRNKGYSINKNIEIYGGFDGNETQRSQRDYRSNITILSGDIGTAGSVSDNCYHVIMTANLNSTAVIDGFTIQDGNSNGGNGTNQFGGRNFSKDLGGGIANNQSSPTLSNLIIKNNRGKNGAGISNRVSSSTLVNLIVADNIATLNGGGVANMVSGTPSIINCVFSGNLADDYGGGIYSENSPTITNCSFFDNTTTTNTKGGGGIYAKNAGTSTVENCIFNENKIGSSKTNIHADIKASSNHTTNMSYSIVQLASSSYTLANSNALSSTSNMVYSGNPLFVNASDPDGADDIWMTKDDGLKLKSTSPAVDAGL